MQSYFFQKYALILVSYCKTEGVHTTIDSRKVLRTISSGSGAPGTLKLARAFGARFIQLIWFIFCSAYM